MSFGKGTQVQDVDKSNPAYRHGHTGGNKFSPTYHSWASMLQRCTNPNTMHYKRYGGRGVSVCPTWYDFENFLADMGERPDNCTLDRVNNDEGYSKDNCRWATKQQQANNKASSRKVSINGVSHTVTEWCSLLGVSKNTVWARINKYGMSPIDALTRPKQDRRASAVAMTASRMSTKFSGKQG